MDIRTHSEGCRRKPDWADRFDGADAVARAPDRPVWLAAICSIILALSGVPTTALSASPEVPPEVRFVGLHGSKAQIRVDNRTYLLSIGERTREGVKLLSANRQQAVVRIGRRNYRFKRGDATGVGLSNRVSLRRRNGLFRSRGAINGGSVDFIIDTGASHVVMSAVEARRLKLRYSKRKPVPIVTASRTESAYLITLASVGIGGIILTKVPALVTRGKFPDVTLLGMSFLGRLRISQDASTMVIQQ